MTLRPSFAALSLLCASSLAAAAAPQDVDVDAAAQACEKALVHSIEQARGRAVHDVQFDTQLRRADTDSQAQVDLRGSGRYRHGAASASFTYTCAYDPKTQRTSGVLFKDTQAAASTAADNGHAWQPDLSRLSPEACETAVAEVLKDKHPRVDHIVFDAGTRRLQPVGPDQRLSGQGRLQRAPGMTPMGFQYGCEFDVRSGKLLRAQAED